MLPMMVERCKYKRFGTNQTYTIYVCRICQAKFRSTIKRSSLTSTGEYKVGGRCMFHRMFNSPTVRI